MEEVKLESPPAQSDVPGALASGFEPRVAQLRALVTVAREASYTRAARTLSYTESAVFLQIRALEKMVGTPVVARRGPRIELTAAGRIVYPYALRVLEDIESMSRDIVGLHREQPIVIGGGRSTSSYYLIPLMAEFAKLYPGARVQLRTMPVEDLMAATEDGLVDLAATGGVRHVLATTGRLRSGLRFTPWFSSSWSLVSPAGKSDLAGLNATYVPDFAWFLAPHIGPALANRGITSFPPLAMMTGGEAVKSAALHGLGAGILPSIAVSRETEAGLLEARRLSLGPDRVMLMHRRPRLLTDAARDLLRFLIQARRRFNMLNE